MAVSVRMDPLLEKQLEQTAKLQGITKSQFIIDAVERALGRKNSYELLLKVLEQVPEQTPDASIPTDDELQLSPTKAAIRAKLRAKHEANQADWLAYQEYLKARQASSSVSAQETRTQ